MPRISTRLACSCAALLTVVATSCDGARDRPTSVVLVMLDTVRADRMQHMGYPLATTPNIATLADRGTSFTNVVAASPWTGPSVASVMTARYPDELGIRDLDDPLPKAAVTLAEVLQAHGWTTGAVVSNGFVAPWFGHAQGYDDYHHEEYTGEDDNHTPVCTADRVTDLALDWISRTEGPFYLYVHYTDPHDPYLPPDEWKRRFIPGPDIVEDAWMQQHAFTRMRLSRAQMAQVQARYDAEIAFADAEIGRLLDGVPEDALVVFIGDHGEEFLDHGGFLHGHTLFEELLRVPLVFRGPGIREGHTVEELVSHVDLAPTILELVGASALEDSTGRSLRSALRGKRLRGDPRTLFAVREYGGVKYVAARQGRWKAIASEQSGQRALFDLEADPLERRNLADDHPQILGDLLSAIDQRKSRIQDAPELDSEELRQKRLQDLRSLGYIQ